MMQKSIILLFTIIFISLSHSPQGNISSKEAESSAEKKKALVGAYYYAWYGGNKNKQSVGWMKQALRGRLSPPQLPKLGIYDSRDPKVIGDHIAQSVRAGIDFWAVSWWGGHKTQDDTFRNKIMKHPQASKLKYAALYESTGRLGSFKKPHYSNLIPDFEYLKKHYFDDNNYLKIDGKPVVFIYLTRVYFRSNLKGQQALSLLRKKFPELYLIGDEVFGPHYKAEFAKNWDGITAYDVYGQSLQIKGASQDSLDRLNQIYKNAQTQAHLVSKAFIPAISPGFNDRAVRNGHAGRARYFKDREDSKEGDIFREMIRQSAIPFLDQRAQNMVMVTSFNEWYEDTQIEATPGKHRPTTKDDSKDGKHYTQGDRYVDYGNLYLDILKEEFSK